MDWANQKAAEIRKPNERYYGGHFTIEAVSQALREAIHRGRTEVIEEVLNLLHQGFSLSPKDEEAFRKHMQEKGW